MIDIQPCAAIFTVLQEMWSCGHFVCSVLATYDELQKANNKISITFSSVLVSIFMVKN